MMLTTWILTCLTAWLGIYTLKVALGRTDLPKPMQRFKPSLFFIPCLALSILGFYCLNLALPPLQSSFAWLGLLSTCGIIQLFINPTQKASNTSRR